MTIPSNKKIRKSFLEFLGRDKNYHSLNECVIYLEKLFKLTEEEKQLRHGGKARLKIFRHRVTNTVSEFRIAELIEDETKPGDASFRINETGLELLERKCDEITNKVLKEYGKYSSLDKIDTKYEIGEDEDKSSEENIEEIQAYHAHKVQVELLIQIKNHCTDQGFEKLCLKLFEEMGYGKSKHTGQPGDRGVDGIISDPLMIMRDIYVQTKQYAKNVQYDEVEKFSVKCHRDNVSGIFITTSDFTPNTKDEWEKDSSITLISGEKLAEFLYRFNVAIELDYNIEIKKINSTTLQSFN